MFIHGEAPRNRFEDSKVIWGSAPVSETFICTFISCYVYLFLFMCIYFFLCIFMSFYFLLFLFISIYFFLFLFIGVYFFLFLFISLFWRKKKKIWFLTVFFWLSDHPNHVVTNLLQPAPPLSLADFRMFQEPCLSQMEWNCWRIGGALDFFFKVSVSVGGFGPWPQRTAHLSARSIFPRWNAWTKKMHCGCSDPSVPFIARLGNRKSWSCVKSKLLSWLVQTTTSFDHVWDMRFPCYKSTNSNRPRYILTNDLDIEHAKYKLNDIVVCWKTF